MSKLYLTTVELWPAEARRQLRERRISVQRLREWFGRVVFPWDSAYGSYRFFYKQEIAEFPLFVVVFTHAAVDREAVRLLDLVHAKRLQLRVISGRHSSAIQNPHVYADISQLHGVRLLPPPPPPPPPISISPRPRSAPPSLLSRTTPPPLPPSSPQSPPSPPKSAPKSRATSKPPPSSSRPKSKPTLDPGTSTPMRSPPRPRQIFARTDGVTRAAKRCAVIDETTSPAEVCVAAPIVRSENGRDSNVRSDDSKRETPDVEANVRIEVEGGATQGQVYRYLFECATPTIPTAQTCAAAVHFAGGHLVHPSPSLALSIRASGGGGDDAETGFAGGSAGSVGANALISCGGIGTLHRTYGLAVDRVERFRIALPPRPERAPSAVVLRQSSDRSVKKTKKGEEEEEKAAAETGARPVRSSRIVTASATRNRNLFWALRGGQAANFGIVLSSVSRSISVGRVLVYARVMPWSAACQVLLLWQRTAPQRPRAFNETLSLVCTRVRPDDPELAAASSGSTDATVAAAADGNNGDDASGSARASGSPFAMVVGERNVARNVVLSGIYVLGAAETERHAARAVRRELAPFARFGGTSTLDASDYAATVKRIGDERTYKPFSAIRVVLGRPPLGVDAARSVIENLAQNPTVGFHALSIELLGGAVRDVAPRATAYVARDANFLYDLVSYWDSALDTAHNSAAVERMFRAVYRPGTRDVVYVGFPINRLPHHLDAYYGVNKTRLVAIKNAVDPLHVLAFPTGIVEAPHRPEP